MFVSPRSPFLSNLFEVAPLHLFVTNFFFPYKKKKKKNYVFSSNLELSITFIIHSNKFLNHVIDP